eukprot:gb/GEZN01001231.1/.p1 GENE.gb/GEZN01001231.1/~~gb/GEZN01001231.1/.p1  ORF type:complete len:919 (-),score=155.09 gb/GEZN01001231.1/:152-2908(-)
MGVCHSGASSASSGGSSSPEETDAVLAVPYFSALSKQELDQLREGFERKEVLKGQVLQTPGEKRTSSMGIILRGSVIITANNTKQQKVKIRELGVGEFYGDVSSHGHKDLEEDGLTVTAAENTTVLTGDGAKLKQILRKHPRLGEAIANVCGKPISLHLRDIPLFSEVNVMHLQQLAAMCIVKTVKAGVTLCAEGEAADGFYYIISGRVQVSVQASKNQEIFLSVLQGKDWFGEIALLEETTRTATAKTIADCMLLFLTKESFNTFLDLAPGLRDSEVFISLVSRRTGNHLKSIPLFHELKNKKTQIGPMEHFDEKKLQLLGELFKWHPYKAGEQVWKEGDLQESFYIVIKGTLVMKATDGKGKMVELSRFGVHEWFGEAALLGIEGGRWTSTVSAEEDCLLLQLGADNFTSFRQIAPAICGCVRSRLGATTGKQLRTIPFFAEVKENRPWSKLDLLGDLFTFEVYDSKARIVEQGQMGTKFYVLVSGECNVTIAEAGKAEEQFITKMVKGDWFGEIALMRDTPRTASCTALTDVVLVSITKEKFNRFLDIAPELTEPFEMMLDIRTARMLRSVDIFKNVRENRPWSKLEVIGSLFDYLHVDGGKIVYEKAEKADLFYVLIKGEVELEDDSGKKTKQGEKTSLSFKPSLEGVLRGETCRTVTACLFGTMGRELFPRLVAIAPEILKHFGQGENALNSMRKSIGLINAAEKSTRASLIRGRKSLIKSRRSSPDVLKPPGDGPKQTKSNKRVSKSETSISISLGSDSDFESLETPNAARSGDGFLAGGPDSPIMTETEKLEAEKDAVVFDDGLEAREGDSKVKVDAPKVEEKDELSAVASFVATSAVAPAAITGGDDDIYLEAWQRLPEFNNMVAPAATSEISKATDSVGTEVNAAASPSLVVVAETSMPALGIAAETPA